MVGLSEAHPTPTEPAPVWAEAVRRNAGQIEGRLAGARASGADDTALGEALRAVGPAFDSHVMRHHLDVDRWAIAMASLVGRLLADGQLRTGSPRHWALTTVLPSLGGDLSRTTPQLLSDLTTAAGRLTRVVNLELWAARLGAATLAAGSLTDGGVRELGALAAWRAGQVRLRDTALTLAERTSPAVLDAVLDNAGAREAIRLNVARPIEWPGEDGWPRRVGGFSGFGGPWRHRPIVVGGDGFRWSVRAGDESWIVLADAFGAAIIPDEQSGLPTPRPAEGTTDAVNGDVTGEAHGAGSVLVSRASSYTLTLHRVVE